MAKRTVFTLFICLMLTLSGCVISSRETAQGATVVVTERPVGEDVAKIAGLAMIAQAFSLTEADGSVQVSYKQVDGAADKNYYIVYLGGGDYKTCRAFAHVRAYTGQAYRVERSLSEIPMTEAQRTEAQALGTMEEAQETFAGNEGSCMLVANAYIKKQFPEHGEVKSVSLVSAETDSEQFPIHTVNCEVEMYDGTIYNVSVAWPQKMVISVGIG